MGKSNLIPPSLTEKDIQRFWNHVNKEAEQGPQGTCWQWNATGKYGQINIGGRTGRIYLAHRVAFFLATSIWSAVNICHRCDNPPCCNPEHLFEGTDKVNLDDARTKGRIPKGWPCHPDNRGDKNGTRKHPERFPKGSQKHNARLNEESVITIRALYAQGNTTIYKLGIQFNVSYSLIGKVIKRRIWKHV